MEVWFILDVTYPIFVISLFSYVRSVYLVPWHLMPAYAGACSKKHHVFHKRACTFECFIQVYTRLPLVSQQLFLPKWYETTLSCDFLDLFPFFSASPFLSLHQYPRSVHITMVFALSVCTALSSKSQPDIHSRTCQMSAQIMLLPINQDINYFPSVLP